jgi:hypothetical protein
MDQLKRDSLEDVSAQSVGVTVTGSVTVTDSVTVTGSGLLL